MPYNNQNGCRPSSQRDRRARQAIRRERRRHEYLQRQTDEFLLWALGVRLRNMQAPQDIVPHVNEAPRTGAQPYPTSRRRGTHRAGRRARERRENRERRQLLREQNENEQSQQCEEIDYMAPHPRAYSPTMDPPHYVSDTLPTNPRTPTPPPSIDHPIQSTSPPPSPELRYIPLPRTSPDEPQQFLVNHPLVEELLNTPAEHTLIFVPPPSTVTIQEVATDDTDIIILD